MEKKSKNTETSVQVSLKLLDTLMSLAGELVLGRNQLLQGINNTDMDTISVSGQRIDLITSEIQDVIMRTRMQSVEGLFGKIIQKFGKWVILDNNGKDVELDRTILETMHKPLEDLVEVFIDDGKTNKNEITLKAFQDAGYVNIVVSAGTSRILSDYIPDKAAEVIEGLGGIVDVEITGDEGCDLIIKLPLTLAIIPSQMTSIGNEKFAIPQTKLSELLRIPAAEVKDKIEKVGDAEVIRLRGELLPLLDLSALLDIPRMYLSPESGETMPERRINLADRRSPKYNSDGSMVQNEKTDDALKLLERDKSDRRQHKSSATNIAVVSAGNYKYGLVVDRFHDSEEIVVKPVGRHLKDCQAYAGATILGDGKVSLILNILNLAQMSGLSTVSESNQLSDKLQQGQPSEKIKESIVVFKNLETEYFAASFEYVQRIERFSSKSIECIGGRNVVQYRGGALPLYQMSQIIDVEPLPERELQEVVVFSVNEKEFGLMVTPPVDILEIHLDVDTGCFEQNGVKGTMNINGHTTLIVDTLEMAESLLGEVLQHD